MRIYIGGPMRGLPDLNFPAFHEAAAMLRAEGHHVFNPAESDFDKAKEDVTIREALKVDLLWILEHAECVALLPGWRHSLGATAELALANALDLKAFEL